MRTNRKLPLRRWQALTHRRMSNRKRILKAKCAGVVLRWPALFPLRRQLPVIFSKRSLEYVHARHLRLRHRRLTAGVEHHHDEHPSRTIATVHLVSSVSDRTTLSLL